MHSHITFGDVSTSAYAQAAAEVASYRYCLVGRLDESKAADVAALKNHV